MGKIITKTNDEFLTERSKGIGGSDITAIIGINEYKTPLDVWEEKTGKVKAFEGNKHTMRGQLLEDSIAKWFEYETGYKVIKSSAENIIYFDDDYPFLRVTPDRRFIIGKGKRGTLECKSALKVFEAEISDIPKSWFTQTEWGMNLTGDEIGAAAWINPYFEYKYIIINLVFEFISYLKEKAIDFWQNNVLKDIPPDPINSNDINKIYARHTMGKFIEATDKIKIMHDELKELTLTLKNIEERIEEKKEKVKMFILDAEGVEYMGKSLFTYKTTKDLTIFDKKLFEGENPELYKKYLKSKIGYRKFLIK